GNDPRTARMRFYWQRAKSGSPILFFSGREGLLYWARSGIRLSGGALIVFLHKIKPATGGLQFESAGYAIAHIANPDADPAQWQMRVVEQRTRPFDALPGGDAVVEGDYAIVLATRQKGTPAGAFVRYPIAAFAKGDLS